VHQLCCLIKHRENFSFADKARLHLLTVCSVRLLAPGLDDKRLRQLKLNLEQTVLAAMRHLSKHLKSGAVKGHSS
jgi:hypothetical protein